MQYNIGQFDRCSNCGACSSACPTGAITIQEDGLYYTPQIQPDKCTACGLCARVCPVNTPQQTQQLSYAVGGFHKDKAVVKGSSSGGAFYALAKPVLDAGGVVFGAAYSEDWHRVEMAGTDEVSLESLQKSKYVESAVGDTFIKVRKALEAGRKVLFCGAPCQVAGLKRYLKDDHENLLTCDFSCGGVPSHGMFHQYLEQLERRYRSKVVRVDFRPKTLGWKTHAIHVEFENGKRYHRASLLDSYFRGFIHERVTIRDYCYECDFADNHASDIILADFWLNRKLSSLPDNDTGISLLIANSTKGVASLRALESSFRTEQLDLEDASYNIRKRHRQEDVYQKHCAFVEAVEKQGFSRAADKYLSVGWKESLKQIARQLVYRIRRR